jgi:hypothetical protein
VGPEITEGCEGTAVVDTASVWSVPFPHELEGVTVIIPAVVPLVTVMLLVPCPAVIDQPEGTVHVLVTPG